MAADPETMPHFRQSTAFDGFNREHGRRGHYCRGFGRGLYSRLNSTKFLRSRYGVVGREAVADDAALMVVVKSITQRLRPTDVAANGNYSDTFFQSSKSPFGKGTSFPSGHALMSFSVATVFARRYRQHHWVPYIAYGLASVISFSRVTTGAHFSSDVFIGAALGYVIARYDVVRQ
jgi:membrane-associated phospholipid phosphatase